MLVLVQGLHSIEEYAGKLWEVFPPATYLTGLISTNHQAGFLMINAGLFLFGLWCWYVPVRRRGAAALQWIVLWMLIETINAIGHPVWSLYEGRYTPGLITSLLLIPILIVLYKQIAQTR